MCMKTQLPTPLFVLVIGDQPFRVVETTQSTGSPEDRGAVPLIVGLSS